MPYVSNYVLNDQGNFHLKVLCHLKDIVVFVVESFSLPHPVNVQLVAFSQDYNSLFNYYIFYCKFVRCARAKWQRWVVLSESPYLCVCVCVSVCLCFRPHNNWKTAAQKL